MICKKQMFSPQAQYISGYSNAFYMAIAQQQQNVLYEFGSPDHKKKKYKRTTPLKFESYNKGHSINQLSFFFLKKCKITSYLQILYYIKCH